MGRHTVRQAVAAWTVAAVAGTLGLVALAAPAGAADPCGVGSNPVVCENSKPGTDPSVWDISGAGDSSIQGFATDISVNVGGTIGFKIDTAASAYTVDIYRTGWYGGLGARKIASVSPSAPLPQKQPACITDATTELYDCGNWAVSASWTVPTTAVSGVYVAKLTDTKLKETSQITFIVRNDASHSDIVMQTSDPTWEAYNTYGGSDFYQGGANGRAYKISYNRPFNTRGLNSGRDFYFSSEYATVRFLEKNGYDVSYLAGVDSDRYGSLLKNHRTFLSVGHDEYWSGAQRANVQAARDAGVNLAFLSGNEIYWRTRYEPSIDGTSTSYRTLVSYKETWSDAKIDPSPEWTGTWRDPRFAAQSQGGGLPENGLSGTMYMANSDDLAVTVSAREGQLRLWRSTSLTNLAPGTTAALAAHTIGYESDEDISNAFRPAGLIDLSTTVGSTPQYLQDFGSVVQPGTTTHHLTLYRAASGALVFSAGSIQWSWGLDQTHDGSGAPADSRMQQAMVNLLADMGVQPLTLMSGLVAATASTDTVGPTTVISSPLGGATIPNGTTVTVSGSASDTGGGVVAGVEVSTDGGTTWHPATGTTTWSYTFVQAGLGTTPVMARAIDDSANIGVAASTSVSVTCPCSIYGTTVPVTPASSDTSAVELGLRFSASTTGYVTGVRFYKGTGNTGTHTGSVWSSAGQRLATVTFSGETSTGWQQATFSPAVAVSPGSTYVVSYTAPAGHYAVQSGAFWYAGVVQAPLSAAGGLGNYGGVYGSPGTFPAQTYGASQYYVDVVFSDADTTPLTIGAQSPYPGSTSVPPGTPISVTFSKAVTSVSLKMATASGTAVAGTTSYDSTSRVATFSPSSALAPSTAYTVTAAGTSNTGGVTGGASWTFASAAPDQVAGASTVSFYNDSATPATLEVPDYSAVTLGVRFASSVDGTVRGIRFYKGPNNTGTHVGALWAVGSTTPLAQVTFTGESTMGWQTATFSTPVRIARDTEYVVSYRTTVGRYAATAGAFSGTGLQRDPLRTASNSGMYSYADAYPGSTGSTSYMVDVVFTRDATPLTVVSQTPAAGTPGAPVTTPVSVTMSAALAPGASLVLSNGTTNVTGTTALSSDGLTLTFTPSSSLAAGVTYTATASGLVSTAGATSAPVSWSFTTATAGGCPCTIFGSVSPQTTSANDSSAVELGVSFTPTQSGLVAGVRFYKGAGNGGTHTGTLWSSTGTALRTVTFSGETSSGWQTATFATPYEVTVGTTYVVSYLAPQGHYAVTQSFFTANVVSGPLTAPATGNGRYQYGGGFPTNTWQQSNYFVDVVFTLAPPSLPTVSSTAPPSGATGVSTGATISATLSKAPASGTPTLALTGPSGAVAGSVAYDATALRVTFTPSAALAAGTSYSAAVSLGGTALAGGAWSFTTAAPVATAVSIWPDSTVPTYPSWNDPATVQVGTRFTASVAGSVTAIRFYKGSANTGTHTVMLWGPNQTLLGQAPSTSEAASGWQTVPLATPVTLTAGQTYTASYLSSTGGYAVTPNLLASPITSGVLSTPAGAGAYVYGSGYPGSSSNAWYGVDLVFVPAG